jgi:hypothetical protein
MKKIGIWIVLILTSLALVVPSIAILWSIFKHEPEPIKISTDNITITTSTPSETNNKESIETKTPTPN